MKCYWCDEVFEDAQQLVAHIGERHAPDPAASCSKLTVQHPSKTVDFKCQTCEKKFMHKRSLKRHEQETHSTSAFNCDKCKKQFRNKRSLRNHIANVKHGENGCLIKKVPKKSKTYRCRECKAKFQTLFLLYSHKRSSHSKRKKYICDGCRRGFLTAASLRWHVNVCDGKRVKRIRFQKVREIIASKSQWETQSAVQGDARIHSLPITNLHDLQLTLLENKDDICRMVQKDLKELRRIKWYLSAFIRCGISTDSGDTIRYMRCSPLTTLRDDQIIGQIEEAILGVINSFDKAQGEGSQILFERVEKLELRVAKYSPLKGSSYMPLPAKFNEPTKGLINVKNNDNKCFLYSCLAGVDLPEKDPQRVSKYRHRLNEFNMQGIKYPVKVRDISKFEDQNQGISINVFGLEDDRDVVPLRISKEIREKHIHLLLLRADEENEDDESHYVLIKNLSRFLAHLSKQAHMLNWCENCLTPFRFRAAYLEHRQRCIDHDPQVVKMPSPRDAVLRFQQYGNQMRHDYVIYADLESIVVPLNSPLPDPAASSTTRTSSHVPCGFCYVIVKADGTLLKEPVLVHGEENLMERFLLCLRDEEKYISEIRGEVYELDMSLEQEQEFERATKCYLCGDVVPRPGVKKVRDHDWTLPTNNFRGAACQAPCNLNLKRKTYIPVFMHNLRNYDAHHIISTIGKVSDGSDISIVPKNKEKYVCFQWGLLRFLDSLSFLSSSLDKLVADLAPSDMRMLTSLFPDQQKRSLVTRKGVYCYSYFDSFSKFRETSLPPIEAFKNDLTGAMIKPEDYQHAINVFNVFNMDTLQDYHDLYLLTDTILLSDCMENFRCMAMDHYSLDPVHYYTTPGLAFSASLLFTKQKLELIDDIEIHLDFERGLRGGVACINQRYAKANNPYLPLTYCSDKPTSYVMYYDANALYSTALCEKLPTGGFRYLTRTEIDEFDPAFINPDSDTGYLFIVDIVYPAELHDSHNDYPLAPEHLEVQYEALSKLQKKMIRDFQLPEKSTKKLVPNLRDKQNYVVLADTLMLYLELGMELKKIHRIIEFSQSAWLKPYIEHNINMRKEAKSDFQKSFWKLLNNSVFGKTCEAVRRHRNVVLTKEKEKFRKLVRSPLYHSFDIFDHDLVCVERKKAKIVLNRPLFVGQVCLDISKRIMYQFYHQVLRARYGDKIKCCAGDTDSIIAEIHTDDIYKDMYEMREHFDTSDYPKTHPLYSVQNKKVMGKFKDEMNGEPIDTFIGLRAKMYCFKTGTGGEKAVGKGIPRAALKSQLSFEDYENCIKNFKQKSVSFSKISTDRRHNLYTTYSVKKGLSCYDDKRFIMNDNIHTLAHGHFSIKCNDKETDLDSDVDSDMECDSEMVDVGERNLLELVSMMDEL